MGAMKDMVVRIMELFEEGVSIGEIAERLRMDREIVEGVVEQYSNFWD
jgi:orotate phosphoribosyltransferase-like protein